ncbi:MAG TPA: DMT family transporter [Pyrinomonadaceae bacterium]|jgi:drug/metabolite transporter (DMT)-like permease
MRVRTINSGAASIGREAVAPHLALVGVQILFGTWPIVGKIALRALPSTTLVALRVCGAAIAFLILQRITTGMQKIRKEDYARLALYSLLGVVLNQLLFVKGLSLTTVINATLLGTTIPVFTLLVSILLGFDRVSWRKALGILLAASGVVYLVDPLRADFSGSTTLGNLLIVANSISYGAYIAISKDILKRYGALTVITWIFIFGTVATLPVGILTLSETALATAGVGVWLAVIYIIIFPTVGAYYLNAWALQRVAPSTVAAYIYLQPLIAFAFAPLILGERWNSRTWLASALIFAGVAAVTWRERSHAIEEVAEHPDALSH